MADFQIALLQTLLGQIDRQVDAAGDAFRGQMQQAASQARGRLAGLLDASTGDKGQLLARPVISATKTATALGPYRPVVDRAVASLAQMADRSTQILRAAGATAGADPTIVRAIARVLDHDLGQQLDRLIADVFGTLTRAQATRQSATETLSECSDLLERAVTAARGAYDTALMTFTQGLVTQGTAPTDAYVYVGPVDSRIRPFCLRIVGQVFTRQIIDQMDNGITNNTFLRRGGPNCRHLWVPAPADLAALADTGQVVSAAITRARADQQIATLPPARRTA